MTVPPAGREQAGGVVVLDKPEGLTSHDAVARMRHVLGTRRVGHAGTLDPMATGVLIIAYGPGTRLVPYLQATSKHYTATIRLGAATTTDDRTGDPLGPAVPVAARTPAIDEVLARFVGPILQRPSSVSAIKVGGRRAYARVRSGEQVELAARPVTVHALRRTSDLRPAPDAGVDFDIAVDCSTGTYIRAIARDAGEQLGCGGHLTALRRTSVGPFGLDGAWPLTAPGPAEAPVLTLAQAASSVLPAVHLGGDDAERVRHGQRIPATAAAGPQPYALIDPQGTLVAVAVAVEAKAVDDAPQPDCWRYAAVFAAR